MHTRHDTAQVITGKGAGCVMTVKATMPALQKQLKKLPRAAYPTASDRDADPATLAAWIRSRAWTVMPASPQPNATMPATRSGR